MKNDDFASRMKGYEKQPQGTRFLPFLPVLARLDGKAFHTFTKGLRRPWDEALKALMVDTTKFLVQETCALAGYTQSDEISLVWHSTDPDCQIFMDGKTSKMTSVLASMATAMFNRQLPTMIPYKAEEMAFFDCRVWAVPNRVEAANYFLWRVQDAVRNSIQMAGQAQYTHGALMGKSCDQIQEMLHEKGINWSKYPQEFKEGSWVQRREKAKRFSEVVDIETLPEKHEARRNPDLTVVRHVVEAVEMPPFSRIANKVEVIFEGADPILRQEIQDGEM